MEELFQFNFIINLMVENLRRNLLFILILYVREIGENLWNYHYFYISNQEKYNSCHSYSYSFRSTNATFTMILNQMGESFIHSKSAHFCPLKLAVATPIRTASSLI